MDVGGSSPSSPTVPPRRAYSSLGAFSAASPSGSETSPRQRSAMFARAAVGRHRKAPQGRDLSGSHHRYNGCKRPCKRIHFIDTRWYGRSERYIRRGPRFRRLHGKLFWLQNREHCRLPQDRVDRSGRYECEKFLKKKPTGNRNYLSEGFKHDMPSNTDSLLVPRSRRGETCQQGAMPLESAVLDRCVRWADPARSLPCLGSTGVLSPGSE